MVIALVIALPLGAWVGHTGRGGFLVVGSANALRALPTLGLLILLVTPFGLEHHRPTHRAGRARRPAAPGGHLRRGAQRRSGRASTRPAAWACAAARCCCEVELPNALPLIIGGVRSAVLQVIATATIAAYVGLGGLGRLHHRRPRPARLSRRWSAASLLVALLAIVVDLLLAVLQKVVVSPGLQAVPRSGPRRLRAVPDHPSAPPPVRPEQPPITPSWRNRS